MKKMIRLFLLGCLLIGFSGPALFAQKGESIFKKDKSEEKEKIDRRIEKIEGKPVKDKDAVVGPDGKLREKGQGGSPTASGEEMKVSNEVAVMSPALQKRIVRKQEAIVEAKLLLARAEKVLAKAKNGGESSMSAAQIKKAESDAARATAKIKAAEEDIRRVEARYR